MPLIICEDCGKEFSDKALSCPNCACPNKVKNNIENSQEDEKMKNKVLETRKMKCKIKLNGNENFGRQISKTMIFITKVFIALLGVVLLLGIFSGEGADFLASIAIVIVVGLVGAFALAFLTHFLAFVGDPFNTKGKAIHNFYKERFPDIGNPKLNYSILDTISKDASNFEMALFFIRREAFKQNADAIIIKNTNTSSNDGIKSTSVSASLIKYSID